MLAAILVIICGACVITCCDSEDDNPVVSPTDDSSQFVTLSEAFVHYADVSTNEQHLDHYTLSVCLTNNTFYTANAAELPLVEYFAPNHLCNFDQGYEQTTFHKLTGWGNWLRTNQQLVWGNPTSNGGGPLE